MAEQVTGSIGLEQVTLNNAASEATLLKLLEAVKAASGAAAAAKTANLAGAAGVDPNTVDKVNNSLNRANTTMASGVNPALVNNASALQNSNQQLSFWDQAVQASANVLKSFARGGATTTSVLDAFGQLPGPIGFVASGFAELSKFQNENLLALQSMSSAGVTFGGALTNIRIAATNAYLDLSQFSNVIKNNADVFASMGGNAQEGVNQFVRIQNKLLAPGSETAGNLATLGFSMADAAELTASYMRAQGNMNKEGLKNTTDVTKAVAAYAQELTLLSEISGKSREEIRKQLDKENMEAQWKNLLATMSPEEARKANMGLAQASLQGQGAIDYFKAKMMGFPPLTEQGQLFAATQRAGTEALNEYARTTKDASISADEAAKKNREALAKAIAEGGQDMNKMRSVLQASGLTGGALSRTLAEAQNLQTKFMKDGKMMSEDQIKAQLEKMDADTKQADSQAQQVQEGELRMKQLYGAFLNLISPLVTVLTPALKYLGPVVLALAATIATVNIGLALFRGVLAAVAVFERAKMARELAAGTGGGALNFAKQFAGLGGGKASPVAAVSGTVASVMPGGASGGIGSVFGSMLGGLAEGLKKLGNPQVMLGIVSLGLLSGAMMIAGKAFKEFTGVSWGDVLIGSVVLTGLAIGAAALVEIAPFIAISAVAIGLLGGAIWLLAKGLKEFPSFAIPGMSEAFEGFGKIVGTVFDFVGGVITGLLNTIKTVFGVIWDIISWPFKMIGNLVSGAVDVVGSIFGTLWDIISWPFKQLGSLLSGTVSVISSIFGTVWDIVSWPFKQLGNLVSSTVSMIVGVFRGLLDGITTIFSTIWDIISWPFKAIGSLVTNVFEGVTGAIKWVFDKLSDVLGLIGGIVKGIAGFFGRIFGGGEDDKKDEGKGVRSPEFTRATSVLLEAANKMNVAADKLMASANAINQRSPVAGPSFFETVRSALTGSSIKQEKPETENKLSKEESAESGGTIFGNSRTEEKTVAELAALNNTMKDILRYMKDTADNTKKNIDATRALNGNLFSS